MDAGALIELVEQELADDPTIDITTIGRRSGQPRRLEIWMLAIDGRFYITGTPGRRDWIANLLADPTLLLHLKRHAGIDVHATAITVDEPALRRHVLSHPSATWYVEQEPLDVLVATAPMVEIIVAVSPG